MSDLSTNADLIKYKTKFNSDAYLKSWYTDLSNVYLYYIRSLIRILNENQFYIPKNGKGLDFGGGASLWPSFILSQYIDSIQFCDYTPTNLQAVQAWLDRSDQAHDWSIFFRFILQEKQLSEHLLVQYEEQFRQALNSCSLSVCDVNDPNCPILSSPPNQYDIIISCECLEAACQTRQQYKQAIKRLVRILKPGGLLILFGVINSSYYIVGNERFLNLPVDEKLVCEAMEEANIKHFDMQSKRIGARDNSTSNYFGNLIITALKPTE